MARYVMVWYGMVYTITIKAQHECEPLRRIGYNADIYGCFQRIMQTLNTNAHMKICMYIIHGWHSMVWYDIWTKI